MNDKINGTNVNKKEKVTFSKIEILFMIVLVALLMVAGITVFSLTTKKQTEDNLKRDAIQLALLALNEYTYQFMHNNEDDIVVGTDQSTKGMCITVNALDKNNDYENLNGYFVIEETANKEMKVSVWLTDNKLVIDGYASDRIDSLTSKDGLLDYNKEEFEARVATSFTGAEIDKGGLFQTPNRYETGCITEKIE